MDKILVSACLLGDKTTYKGGDNLQPYLRELNEFYDLVPFCCEVEGGLSIPRLPSEIRGNSVLDSEGKDVTSSFRLGVYKASSIVSFLDIRIAILKENSPSCGVHFVHDGSFRNRLVKGQGLLARELTRLGVHVMNEEEGRAYLEELKRQKAIKDEKTLAARSREASPEAAPEEKKPFEKRPQGGKKRFDKPFKGKSFKGKGFEHKGERGEKKKDYGVRKPVTFKTNRHYKGKKG